MGDFIQTRKEQAIGMIELDRPNVLNALNRQMVKEIVSAAEAFDADDNVRVIVLQGKGRAFAAGADVKEISETNTIELEQMNQFADWDRLQGIKKPLLAAVHGLAYGGGFELALSCDLIFAADDTKFAFPEVNLGVMPSAGGTQRLTKLMGRMKAMEWMWFGEPMGAEEALHHGVINRIFSSETFQDDLMAYAQRLSEQAPLSLRMIKEAVNKAVDSTLNDGLQLERKNFSILFSSKDQTEGMNAFLEKRNPYFKGE